MCNPSSVVHSGCACVVSVFLFCLVLLVNKANYELIAANFCHLGQDANLLSLKTPLQKAKSFAFDLVSEQVVKQRFFEGSS